MHDFGGLIWVIIVLAGVISSVVKSAKKAARDRPAGEAPAAARGRNWQMTNAALIASNAPQAATSPSPQSVILSPQSFTSSPQPVTLSAQRPTLTPAPVTLSPSKGLSPPPSPTPAPVTLSASKGDGGLALPANFHLDFVPQPVATGFLRGMFKDRKALVRGIVAAEVLGKPKALQEQSIWSPRHSEPSI